MLFPGSLTIWVYFWLYGYPCRPKGPKQNRTKGIGTCSSHLLFQCDFIKLGPMTINSRNVLQYKFQSSITPVVVHKTNQTVNSFLLVVHIVGFWNLSKQSVRSMSRFSKINFRPIFCPYGHRAGTIIIILIYFLLNKYKDTKGFRLRQKKTLIRIFEDMQNS